MLCVVVSVKMTRQRCDVREGEDRKMDQVVGEVGRYVMVVVALQETK